MTGPRIALPPEVAAQRLRGMEYLLRGIHQDAAFWTGQQRMQIKDLAAGLAALARIADGKAGNHDHQRV
ncbi:hypothetical protein [Corynebacterium mastitidis]|uniref:hypothetical protein n=1 Tax=Corynebacterium mastitidis TaxID=161890 RepID=UPI00254D0C25|nr:hypothetical protein [Corynebacterium mastitidis]MDK8450963.1 hypothetical protein [Corynebacterium mastitidis]